MPNSQIGYSFQPGAGDPATGQATPKAPTGANIRVLNLRLPKRAASPIAPWALLESAGAAGLPPGQSLIERLTQLMVPPPSAAPQVPLMPSGRPSPFAPDLGRSPSVRGDIPSSPPVAQIPRIIPIGEWDPRLPAPGTPVPEPPPAPAIQAGPPSSLFDEGQHGSLPPWMQLKIRDLFDRPA